jgi:hypothetical protein
MTTIAVLAIIAVIVFALGALSVWRVLRRVRRYARVSLARVASVRSQWLPPGPRRDAANLRRSLIYELDCTRGMLTAAPDGQVFRADAVTVLRDLTAAGAALERDLRNIERFADPAQQQAALATVEPQVTKLIETSYSARQTILTTAARDRERQLGAVSAYVAQQAQSADTYQRSRHELHL